MRVERVVGEVGDPVARSGRSIASWRGGRRVDLPGVGADAVAHLPGQVEVLEHLEDAHALGGVVPAAGREVGRERLLAGVPERRVPDVVAQRDRLGQRLVERQRGGQRRARSACTWRVWVRRVTKWSPSGLRKTWVLCLRRRNALEWMIRSRSRSNAVRNVSGSSGRARPREVADRVADDERRASSASRTGRSRRRSGGFRGAWVTPGRSTPGRRGTPRFAHSGYRHRGSWPCRSPNAPSRSAVHRRRTP